MGCYGQGCPGNQVIWAVRRKREIHFFLPLIVLYLSELYVYVIYCQVLFSLNYYLHGFVFLLCLNLLVLRHLLIVEIGGFQAIIYLRADKHE